jgi:hypothetical protein
VSQWHLLLSDPHLLKGCSALTKTDGNLDPTLGRWLTSCS